MDDKNIKSLEKLIIKCEELILRSEERIDKTNDMVSKCVAVINTVTNTYVEQISKLQSVRDELVKQNAQLISLNEKQAGDMAMLNKRYDSLLARVFDLVPRGSSENNINVR